MEYERKMLIIKRVILGRNEGKRKYVSRTGLSCKCRVANGSRGRKQGGISRTKRGRSRWKQGEEAGLSKIYKERGINEIYKGREKLILVGEEYVRFNVTHTHTHTHTLHIPVLLEKRTASWRHGGGVPISLYAWRLETQTRSHFVNAVVHVDIPLVTWNFSSHFPRRALEICGLYVRSYRGWGKFEGIFEVRIYRVMASQKSRACT